MDAKVLEETLFGKIKVLSETTWETRADKVEVENWLKNFADDKEKIHSLFLLSQFMYFSGLQIRELLKALYRDLYKYPIIESIRKSKSDTLDLSQISTEFELKDAKTKFIGIGNPSESGTHLLYFFRQENAIPKTRFINAIEIVDYSDPKDIKLKFTDVEQYVFIDDFCGSGSQANKYSDVVTFIKSHNPAAKISYLMLFATRFGISEVKKMGKFDIVEALVELDESFRCFHDQSRYFKKTPAPIDKAYAKAMCEKYGFDLFKSVIAMDGHRDPVLSEMTKPHKLGYNDCQLLIGFFHNTPDNTLPIIWYNENEIRWYPIFKRYNKKYL